MSWSSVPAPRAWPVPSPAPSLASTSSWWKKNLCSVAPVPGRAAGCGSPATRWQSPKGQWKSSNKCGLTCAMNCTARCSTNAWRCSSNKARRWSIFSSAIPKCNFSPAARCLTFMPAKVMPGAVARSAPCRTMVVGWVPGSTSFGVRWTSSALPGWVLPVALISTIFSTRADLHAQCCMPANACCATPVTC
ncbi:hypothetical protein D3C72_1432040 [compost metagenome]